MHSLSLCEAVRPSLLSPRLEVHTLGYVYLIITISSDYALSWNSKKDSSLDDLASVTHQEVSFVWSLLQAALRILFFRSAIYWQAHTSLSFSFALPLLVIRDEITISLTLVVHCWGFCREAILYQLEQKENPSFLSNKGFNFKPVLFYLTCKTCKSMSASIN